MELKMKPHYASCDNYFSIDEMEKLAVGHDLNVRVVYDCESFYFVLHSLKLGLELGRSRRLVKIPKHSRFPRLSSVCCSNRWIVDNFA